MLGGTLYLGHGIKKIASIGMKVITDSEQSCRSRRRNRLCEVTVIARWLPEGWGEDRGREWEGGREAVEVVVRP
jgi:hypothetical protein